MTDLIVSYKGSDILTADASLSRKLDTAGKYCEEDITIQYNRPTFSTQTKSVTPTESAQTVTPDSGYDGLSKVNVARIPTNYIVPSGTKSITENGTGIDVTNYASVDVSVSGGGVTMVSVNVGGLNRQSLSSPWEYGCLVDGSSTVTRDEDYNVIVSCPENSMFVVAVEMMPPMGSTGTVSYQEIYSRGPAYYYAVFAGASGGSIY